MRQLRERSWDFSAADGNITTLASGRIAAAVSRTLRPAVKLAMTFAALLQPGCDRSAESPKPTANPKESAKDTPELAASIQTFCGACHAVPSPDSFPRDDWYEEVRRGFNFYYASGRTDLKVPVQSDVVNWFQSRAQPTLRSCEQQLDPSPLAFEERSISSKRLTSAATSFVEVDYSKDNSAPQIWCSDMFYGVVHRFDAVGSETLEVTDSLQNPAAARRVDLDADGTMDLLVAEMGSPVPEDHEFGKVYWFRNVESKQSPVVILENVGRVADVRPADFDGDGDLDLVVAEFGWHETGGIHYLQQEKTPDGSITWKATRLDARPGTIHVPVTDINNDGRPDFVALISQEHEVIEAFLNLEAGFKKVRLWSAPDPSYGSSGIDLVDFDQDGDLDILYTNGDTFDSRMIKPYHGVWLVSNLGELKFEAKKIAELPGVHRALPTDLDKDGDLDIVAAALLPLQSIRGLDPANVQDIIWLEQKPDQSFARHLVHSGTPQHAAMSLSDLDADGQAEIIVGCFDETRKEPTPVIQIYKVQGTAKQ
ncbi:MAG: VCBS repeat-containing protein [Planctomycetaceae bacterium]|nr:VCBS repeat-containing protein [Planctomycetaceae bacterium]